MPVTSGEVISVGAYVRPSKSQRMFCSVFFYDASGAALSTALYQYGTSQVVCAANVWTFIGQSSILVPAAAVRVVVAMYSTTGTGSSLWAVNDYLDTTGVIMERQLAILSYFDGNFVDTAANDYQWAGAANDSQSKIVKKLPDVVAPTNVSDPRTLGWSSYTAVSANALYRAPAGTALNGLFTVAPTAGVNVLGSYTGAAAITAGTSVANGRFVAVHYPVLRPQFQDGQFRNFLLTALNWLNPVTPIDLWETQVGEFMIDRLSEPHRPREIKITGRDYTKKLLMSKFTGATQFAAGQPLEQLVASIAGAGGVSKRLLPATAVVVGREFFFERGVSRWEAIKEICTAYNYEVFFDATGYLTIRPFRDPTTSPPILWLQTGKEGQVASYEKSTSDSRIFNRILVIGENSDSGTPTVWAQAVNDDLNSPTNIYTLGDRYMEISSAFVETNDQAAELAQNYLAINALEEFELSFETLMMPWLEVGDILGWIDPRADANDPDTFLLSSISIPLDLGPMSGSARRVTIINGSTVSPLSLAPNVTWANLPDNIAWRDLPEAPWNTLP